jgi:hypothetical protein
MSNETHSTSNDERLSTKPDSAVVDQERACLGQAKLMLMRFRSGTLSSKRAAVAGQLIAAIRQLEASGGAR